MDDMPDPFAALGGSPSMASPSMPAPPQPPQPQGMNLKTAGPLLALIPMALAKGGQGAVAALLQGFQQAQQLKAQQAQQGYQNQRQAYGDQRIVAQDQADATYRQQQLAGQEQQRQQQLRQQFMQAVGSVDSPEAANALLDFFGPQADALKVPRGDLSNYVLQTVTPTKLQTRAAEKALKGITDAYKPEQLAQLEQAGTKFKVGSEMLTLPDVRARTGVGAYDAQGNAVGAPAKVDDTSDLSKSGLDVQAANARRRMRDAQASGDTAAYAKAKADLDDLEATADRMSAARQNTPIASGAASERAAARETTTFNQIAGAYDRSPLIRAADRTIVLEDAVKAVRANPADATAQLTLAYSFIQALDTYQSAVREGELQNLGVLGTRLQQLGMEANRIATTGAFMPSDVAKQIATGADQLVKTIKAGRSQKEREFASRARVSGVGDMWDQFVAGFGQSPSIAPPQTAAPSGRPVVAPPARAGGAGQAATPGANPFRR